MAIHFVLLHSERKRTGSCGRERTTRAVRNERASGEDDEVRGRKTKGGVNEAARSACADAWLLSWTLGARLAGSACTCTNSGRRSVVGSTEPRCAYTTIRFGQHHDIRDIKNRHLPPLHLSYTNSCGVYSMVLVVLILRRRLEAFDPNLFHHPPQVLHLRTEPYHVFRHRWGL